MQSLKNSRFAEIPCRDSARISVFEKTLGPAHYDVATSLNNLAALYATQGRFVDAEKLYKRSLAIAEKTLGPDHPKVAMSLGNLGQLYRLQSRYIDAEPLYNRGLAILEKTLGPEHPDVAVFLNNLAVLYYSQARYVDAEPLYKRSLAIYEKTLGPNHLNVAATLNNLAMLYNEQGRYVDAELFFQRSLLTFEKALGPDHPSVGKFLIGFADFYRRQGRIGESERLFQRATAIPKTDIKQLDILFGTNRQRESEQKTVVFGGERSEQLTLGSSTLLAASEDVVQRAERRASGSGMLDRSLSSLTSEQIFAIRRMGIADDMATLAKAVRSQKRALVFVHGYNVGFEDALKRTAQIGFDLDFDGALLLFSWPSRGSLLGYWDDGENAEKSADYLVKFLDVAAKEMPGTTFNFIAHSMGNRVLLKALDKMSHRSLHDRRIKIGQIIFAHPDVDYEQFKEGVKTLNLQEHIMTLYTSGSDWALWLSGLLAGKERAGGTPLVESGVDTIDITGLGSSLWSLNHGTFAGNPIVFGDIGRLIASGERPPEKRTRYYEQVQTPQGVYWRYGAPENRPTK